MKFIIKAQEVKLHHLNVRTEMHGDEEKTALDLKLVWETGNDVLLQFHPHLRSALYAAPAADQQPVEGVDPGSPVLVFESMAPLHWKGEAPCEVALHHALGDAQDIHLGDCVADGFMLAPMQGGSVKVTFRVRCVCTDEPTLGRLPNLLHRVIPLSLFPIAKRSSRRKDAPDKNEEQQPSLVH